MEFKRKSKLTKTASRNDYLNTCSKKQSKIGHHRRHNRPLGSQLQKNRLRRYSSRRVKRNLSNHPKQKKNMKHKKNHLVLHPRNSKTKHLNKVNRLLSLNSLLLSGKNHHRSPNQVHDLAPNCISLRFSQLCQPQNQFLIKRIKQTQSR